MDSLIVFESLLAGFVPLVVANYQDVSLLVLGLVSCFFFFFKRHLKKFKLTINKVIQMIAVESILIKKSYKS